MKTLISAFILSITSLTSAAQVSKGLNSYAEYANQSADEMHSVFSAVAGYYPKLFQKGSWNQPRFVCPIQQEEYYYKQALAVTGVPASALAALKALRASADEIDKKCKALDTYHKLEDYKNDKFVAAEKIVRDLQGLFGEYEKRQEALRKELGVAYKKLNPTHGYARTAETMLAELDRERLFLQRWDFNLREEFHSGWIENELMKSIAETDAAVKRLASMSPSLKYPASSMWPSFRENLRSVLEVKRRALDEYNFEAKKSDKHSNDVYLSLINYFNGTLVADYNTFLNFSSRDGFEGLRAVKFVPMFVINDKAEATQVSVTPFRDIPRPAMTVSKQSAPIAKPVFNAMVSYVDYINETYRQVSHHRDVIRNLNSSASYQASLTSYKGRGPLNFSHDDFEVPLSHFQKAVSDGKALPPAWASSLNAGAEVLLNILREMDEIGAVLEKEIEAKSYQQDGVRHVYELLARTHVLFNEWDERKELLYNDLRKAYEAYPSMQPGASWTVSGKALTSLAQFDHDALFVARDFYRGKSPGPVPTASIDASLREVISNEYDNMKGIQKYGRNNGLCPYTPYEDIPKSSRQLSELFQELKPAKENADTYQHPYHSMVYIYNNVVRDLNKFSELSPVPLLPMVYQPELFILVPPKPREPEASSQPTQQEAQQEPQRTQPVVAKEEPKQKVKTVPTAQVPAPKQDTKVFRDTIYIEKRDTIYLRDPSEDLRSMEGYAVNNLVLLLDVSGSMNAPEKLPLLKKSVLGLLSMMRTEDRISIVVFSGKPKVLLPSTSFKDEEKITKAINALKPSGKTDGNAGLKLAYKVADDNYLRGGNNRIVLATDGEFPISADSQALIGKFSAADIFLTVFNFGNRSGSARNLERIASSGKGNYEFIGKENVDLKLIREVKARRSR